jgi:quercetin dioxygenase-like cupin family protein
MNAKSMTPYLSFGLPFCLLLLLQAAAVTAADETRDAVVVDPDVHQVVLENEHIRVFEGMASPGTTSPMHTHPPFLLISLDTARVKMTLANGEDVMLDLRPGEILWLEDGFEHAWELLAGNLHAIGVEVKSAARNRDAGN